MREVGAYEAKNSLGALLDCVAHGEEITITRRGKAVAKLVAPGAGIDRAAARAAAERILELGKGASLGGLTYKDLIDDGRK